MVTRWTSIPAPMSLCHNRTALPAQWRPAMSDGDAADRTQPAGDGELVPMLWSESSPHAELLPSVPHWPVVTGRLHLALAVVTHGTTDRFPVLHHQLGEHSFDRLLAEACENLAAGLQVDARDTPDGRLLSLTGVLVSAAVCLPGFHRTLSLLAGSPVLVAGLPGPDEVHVAAADSPMAAVVERLVRESAQPATELVPTVLRVTAEGVTVVSERDE